MVYTKEKAEEASLAYFGGEELPATGVFVPKYALRDLDDNFVEKDPDGMHNRLADEIYRAESKYKNPIPRDKIYNYIKNFETLIPQGSPMSAIGDNFRLQSSSNCFVIPSAQDSFSGIMHTDQELVQILKRRGGVGTDLSNIRPHGSRTSNAARTAEGVIAFMKRYSNSSREVGQLGRVGALMLTLSIKHPDIFKFIDAKRDRKQITGANISIRTTDEFMKAVEKKQDFTLQWPVDSDSPTMTMKVEASKIWDAIVDAAWDCAEPGLLFWDTAIRRTPSDIYKDEGFGSISTNPCQPSFATVYTRDGVRTIADVEEGDEIWSIDGWTTIISKKSNGDKIVVALSTSEGNLRCTEDHNVYSKGKLVEARNAESLDFVNPKLPNFHKSVEVRAKRNLDVHEVFTLTVDNKSHSYWSDGFIVSNCGEIILSAYDSCRLLVVNLIPFVKEPFTQKANFDFEAFGEAVVDAQRIMDDIIDLEIELVERIIKKIETDPEPEYLKLVELNLWKNVREAALNGRRTGLGITALGDVLAGLNLKYGSPESIKVTEKIYKNLCINSYKSSCIMAGERGQFKVFSHEKEKGHEFLEQIWKASPEVYEIYKKNGRRNIANLTTAPTGSTSIVAKCWDWFGTTGGIEPAIYMQFVRNRKIPPNDTTTRVDYVDPLGDRWHKYDVYHPGVKKFMQVTGRSAEESPYFGCTANDIDPIAGVHLQAAAQRWLCHSISRTLNLPADVKKETVSKVLFEAWKSGCKGTTVYRDGSRNNVLEDSTKTQVVTFDGERPEILECDIHRMKLNGKDWVCFVGMNNGRPWEIFTGLDDSILPPNKKLQQGCTVKRKVGAKSKYDLYFNKGQDTEVIFKDITSHFKNEEYASHTRLISSLLRFSDVAFVVEQLQKLDNEDMFSFIKVVSRVLKTYIKDGLKLDKECPQCKTNALFYVEGCPTCQNCGYAKC